MHTTWTGFVSASLFLAAAFGQPLVGPPLDRTFQLSRAESSKDLNEIATVVRSITEIQQLTTDNERKTLTVRGTSDQIALAEWLISEVDRGDGAQLSQTGDAHKYLMHGSAADNVVRVFLMTRVRGTQDLQEVATLVRSIAEMRRPFIYNKPHAVVFRGSADQVAMAEWLLNDLEMATNVSSSIKHKYLMAAGGSSDNVVRVFYLTHAETSQNLQEAAVVVRGIGDIRRVFTYNAPKAIAVRGTVEQTGLAEWLINELDGPADADNKNKREYTVPGPGDPDNVVRVFSLTHAPTVQRLQEVATQVRTQTQVRRIFTYGAPKMMALRGTPGQVEQANQIIRERDQ